MYRIKEILNEKGLKSKDLAERLGKTKQYISNVVNGTGSVSMSMLSEIADALNVPMWQMFASKEEVQEKRDGTTITCPKCGEEIEVELDLKVK